MKSTEKQLENRGYFSSIIESEFVEKSFDELIENDRLKQEIKRSEKLIRRRNASR